jgi:hypothetical protein
LLNWYKLTFRVEFQIVTQWEPRRTWPRVRNTWPRGTWLRGTWPRGRTICTRQASPSWRTPQPTAGRAY